MEAPLLDVHAPHEKIHGVRDFFLHLFTITVGLLIALGLEGVAERVHHRHQRDEADAYLRSEIQDNQRELKTTTDAIPVERENLVRWLVVLRDRAQNKPVTARMIKLDLTLGSLSNAGWQTASATGVVSYMHTVRAKQFAAAYEDQETFTRLSDRSLDQILQVQSYLAGGVEPATLSPETARLAVIDVQKELAELQAMEQIGATLKQTYAEALKGGPETA